MPWTDDFTGIPFLINGRTRAGVDCYGLIVLVYRERLGIELPGFTDVACDDSPASLRRVARAYAERRETWQRIEEPRPLDVILLRTGKFIWHAGLVIDRRRMLHTMHGIDSSIEDFTAPLWRHRVEEFRHYAG